MVAGSGMFSIKHLFENPFLFNYRHVGKGDKKLKAVNFNLFIYRFYYQMLFVISST
jgi:hypothetical protein